MPVYENKFIYNILDAEAKTATLGDGSNENGNGFVEKTLISGIVDIPSTMDGYTLISLSFYSIRYCNLISELNLPHTLIRLDHASLTVCDSLTKIVFPNSIQTFGDYIDFFRNAINITFERGSKLTSVGSYFLRYCHKLEYLILPSSLLSISSLNCFENNYKLNRIVYLGEGNFENLAPFIGCSPNIIIEVSVRYPSLYFAGIKVKTSNDFKCKSCHLNTGHFYHIMLSILINIY